MEGRGGTEGGEEEVRNGKGNVSKEEREGRGGQAECGMEE